MKPESYSLDGTSLEFRAITAATLNLCEKAGCEFFSEGESYGMESVLLFFFIHDVKNPPREIRKLLKDREQFEDKLDAYGEQFTPAVMEKAASLIEQIAADATDGMIEPDPTAQEPGEKKTDPKEPRQETGSCTITTPSPKETQNKSGETST